MNDDFTPIYKHCKPHDNIIGYRENLAELIVGYKPIKVEILLEGVNRQWIVFTREQFDKIGSFLLTQKPANHSFNVFNLTLTVHIMV